MEQTCTKDCITMARCRDDDLYDRAQVGHCMGGGVVSVSLPRCPHCAVEMELQAPDNRVVCPTCEECITCSACKGYTGAHEKKAQDLLQKIQAGEEAAKELANDSAELVAVTKELAEKKNILNTAPDHEVALQARELSYRQHLLEEKVRAGRQHGDEVARLRQFANRLHEVRAGRSIVLCERMEASFLGYVMDGRTARDEHRRCLKCICGHVRYIDGKRMDNAHAVSHAVNCKIERPATFDLLVYLDCIAGMNDQQIQRLLDRTKIDAENSSNFAVLRSMLNRSVCINKQLIEMRGSVQEQKHRIDGVVDSSARRAAVQLARSDLLIQRLTLKEQEKNSVEKVAVTSRVLEHYIRGATKFQFFRDNIGDFIIGFHSIRSMNSALLFSAFVMSNDDGQCVNEATVDLLECFNAQCLNWPMINEQDIQRLLSRENAQDLMFQHMLFAKHSCVLLRGNSECTVRYSVKEAADFQFNPRTGIDVVTKWGLNVIGMDVLVISAGRQIFYRDYRVQFTGDHTEAMQASFVLQVMTVPSDPSSTHCLSFEVIIEGEKGYGFCPDLVLSGTHTENVASCRIFSVPKRLVPDNFHDLLNSLPLRATSFGTDWHVEYAGESKRSFEERQVYLKMEEKIEHGSKLLFSCAASVPEQDDLGEVKDEGLRAKLLAVRKDGRLKVMKVRNGLSRYYYELATNKPLFRKTGSWDSESARMFIRDKLASLPDFDSGMVHYEIDLNNSSFLHVTVREGLVVCATVSVISFAGGGLLPIGNSIIPRKYYNGVPVIAYVTSVCNDEFEFMNKKHWRVSGDASPLPDTCVGSAFLKTHKQQIDGSVRLLRFPEKSRGIYVEFCGKAYRLIGEEGKTTVLRAQLHSGQPTIQSVRQIMEDVLQHNAVQFKSTFATDIEKKNNDVLTKRMAAFKDGYKTKFCTRWRGKVRAKWAKSTLTVSLPLLTFKECSLQDAKTVDHLKSIVGRSTVLVFIDGEYIEDQFFFSVLQRKSAFSHDGAGIPLPGFNSDLQFTGIVETEHRAPQSPLGFNEVWRDGNFKGYQFTKRYFISCEKSHLRQCDAIVLQLIGYKFVDVGEGGWAGAGLYYKDALKSWGVLNLVHKSIEALPFSKSVISNVQKIYTLSAIRYQFKLQCMNTAEMESIACHEAVRRMMRAFTPQCTKDELLESASLYEAASNGEWWPIAVPFLSSIHSDIVKRNEDALKSMRPQRRLSRCEVIPASISAASTSEDVLAVQALTPSKAKERDAEEENELKAIWEQHIYS